MREAKAFTVWTLRGGHGEMAWQVIFRHGRWMTGTAGVESDDFLRGPCSDPGLAGPQGQPPAIIRAAGRGGIITMWAAGLSAFAWSALIRPARLYRRARNRSSSPAISWAD